MNNRELVRRRIRNMDWPRYLVVCASLATTFVFLLAFGLFFRLLDLLGLDIEWAETTFGHYYFKLEGFESEWLDLIEASDQHKR